MIKHFLIGSALLLPIAALANSHMEKKDAAMPAAAAVAADAAMPAAAAPASALPKCTAKVQDSCDQSKTTEKNALDHYPADTRGYTPKSCGR